MNFKNNLNNYIGETRVVRKFLWKPIKLQNGNTYWLEFADVIQIFEEVWYFNIYYQFKTKCIWKNAGIIVDGEKILNDE